MGTTLMLTVVVEASCESEAVNRKAYCPATENVTRVLADVGELMVAGAGPAVCTHWNVSVPLGSPSSVTETANVLVFPGKTTGAGFTLRLLILGG